MPLASSRLICTTGNGCAGAFKKCLAHQSEICIRPNCSSVRVRVSSGSPQVVAALSLNLAPCTRERPRLNQQPRHRRSAAQRPTHRRQIEIFECRHLKHQVQHCRHSKERIDLVILERLEEPRRIERFHQHGRRADVGVDHDVDQRADVKER